MLVFLCRSLKTTKQEKAMTMYKQYCTNHLSVKLSLAYTLPRTNEARLISLVVDNSFTERKSHTAHPTFHPAILFKMMLFAYARKVFYGRKMIQMTEEVLPMKWLSQDTYVNHPLKRTISKTFIMLQKRPKHYNFSNYSYTHDEG